MKDITSSIAKRKIRFDLELIAQFIVPNSKVLDIGCGDGELLEFLRSHKNVDGRGLEISHLQTSRALMRGLSVIQGNAETDLSYYPDRSFDFAVLSQTIQAMRDPKKILQEMLRIAEFAIVSLPNFAHFKNRFHLLLQGTMPVNKSIPFQWYDTPNIHFCSIKDFENLCHDLGFKIYQHRYITYKHRLRSFFGCKKIANLCAEYGIFLITKSEFASTNQEEFAFTKNLAKKLSPAFSAPSGAAFRNDKNLHE
jgi:methionine biosynthesis protein MetW